jgi:hypothetical protein
MNLISLSAAQRKVLHFKHPVFENCVSYSLEELTEMVEDRIMNDAPIETLIIALRSMSRYLIGRYLWYWPACRDYVDEMVGEAMLANTIMVSKLSRETLDGRDILKLSSRKVRTRIEAMLNQLQSMSAPSLRWQYKLKISEGAPIYCQAVREPQEEDKVNQENEQNRHDALEAIARLRAECDIAVAVLDPENWGLTDKELGKYLKVPMWHIRQCRDDLYAQYLTLTGVEDEVSC